MKINLSKNIKEMRSNRGITQSELAEILSVTPQTVSRWETGLSYPDIELLPVIAAFFDITVDDLMGTSDLVYQKLLEELHETRVSLQKREDIELQKEYCRILKKMAKLKPHAHDIPYFCAIMKLYKSGNATEEQVEEARVLCENTLMKSHIGDRAHQLALIIKNEDKKHVNRWRNYISPDGIMGTWGDVMLKVYENESIEKWEKQRQDNIFSRLHCVLNLLALEKPDNLLSGAKFDSDDMLNPIEQYEAALKLISVFSKEPDDVFLPIRIFIELRYMKSLFAVQKTEEGFALMEKLANHVQLLVNRKGEKRHGTVPFLALNEESDVPRDAEAYSTVSDICNSENHKAFDAVRKDTRFVEFFKHMHEIVGQSHGSVFFDHHTEEEMALNIDEFLQLISFAKKEISTFSEKGRYQIVVTQTDNGNIYHYKTNYNSPLSAKHEEIEFVKNLKNNRDTSIVKMVCMWSDGVIDIPSYSLRELIFKLHKQNRNTLILLRGMKKLIVKKLIDFFPNEKKI